MISFKQFLNEGGNAIANVVRINQENVAATLKEIYSKLLPLLNLSKKDTALLGSTGKKNPHSSSGDIDVAISIKALMKNNNQLQTMTDVMDFVYAKCKIEVDEVKLLKGISIVTMGFPIENVDGKQENEIVQLDFMMSSNITYQEWSNYSPHENDSPFKGLYRNSLLAGISHHAARKENKDKSWSRYLFHLANGLTRVVETDVGKRGQKLKAPKVISRGSPTQDKDEVVKVLLGPSFKADDILTFEDVWKAFKSPKFAWKDSRDEILARFIADINKKGYPVPEFVK